MAVLRTFTAVVHVPSVDGPIASWQGDKRENRPMILGIDNIGLASRDLARSVDFYERVGFVRAHQNERGCTMIIGTTKLFIFPAGPQEASTRAITLVGNPVGIDHISLLVDDVDRSFAELSARGITFTSLPADQTWGARTAVLQDPDGNNLYLLAWLAKN